MTRDEIVSRLKTIREKATRALDLLEEPAPADEAQLEIQSIADWLKKELQNECQRMSPERVQRRMTLLELSVYAPAIQEAWADTGISKLNVDATPNRRWCETMEAICDKAGKYLP